MRKFVCAALLISSMCAAASERRAGRQMREGTPVVSETPAAVTAKVRARAGRANASTGQPQSPVLLQLYRQGEALYAGYAQAVTDLPKGTTLTLFFITPDGKQIQNTKYRYDDGITAGDWVTLPDFRAFGSLWQKGIHTFDLWVETPDGKQSHCLADFTVGYYRSPDEIAQITPLIRTYRIDNSNGHPVIVVSGNFLSEKPLALLEAYVVPSAAITAYTTSEIRIDLSQIPDFASGDLGDYLLTIAQGGASDTLPVRFVP